MWLEALVVVAVSAPVVAATAELDRLLRRSAPSLLETHRVPTDRDYKAEWAAYARARRACPFMLKQDVNRDERGDVVFILPRRAGSGSDLFVLLGHKKGFILQPVDSFEGPAWTRAAWSGGGGSIPVGGETADAYTWESAGGFLQKVPPLIID